MHDPSPEAELAKILLVTTQGSSPFEEALLAAKAGALTVVHDPSIVASLSADLVVVDLDLEDALPLLRQLAARGGSTVTLAASSDTQQSASAITAGARDVIDDPTNVPVIAARIRALLDMQQARRELSDRRAVLEQEVRNRTKELEDSLVEHLERLAFIAEFREEQDANHTKRVGATSGMLAAKIGLDVEYAKTINLAARLHDIGKAGLDRSLLMKQGKFTPEELKTMREHPIHGARFLWGVHGQVLQMAKPIALCHHERWDGGGYPTGFSGEDIPLEARIVGVTDTFDALTHVRPYKPAWPIDEALDEMISQRAKHLDPTLIDAFAEAVRDSGLEKIDWS